jgi:hypothetical protein
VDEELIEYVLKKPVADILNEAAAKGVLKYDELREATLEHDCIKRLPTVSFRTQDPNSFT